MTRRPSRRGPTAREILDCPDCQEACTPTLVAAAASVGIEKGKPTNVMLVEYLAASHRRGHKA